MNDSYKEYQSQLHGEYQATFEQLEIMYKEDLGYFGTTGDDVISDFLDLLLCAQEEAKPVASVIGNNPRRFYLEYVSAFYPYFKIKSFLIKLSFYSGIFLILVALTAVKFLPFSSGYMTGYLSGEISSYIISNYLYHYGKRKRKIIRWSIWTVFMIISIVLTFWIQDHYTINTDIIKLFLGCLILISFAILLAIKISKEHDFSKDEKTILKQIQKQYLRKQKKGMTAETFIQKRIAVYRITFPIINVLFTVLMLEIIFLVSIPMIKHGPSTARILYVIITTMVTVFFSSAFYSGGLTNKRLLRKLQNGECSLVPDEGLMNDQSE